ncbi:hypothetical protein FH969_05810 [Miniimonas arenae]|uniref:Uncharacterized protein n=1 Tax=Miniimonas arenae TaxID=676201 RepID=A0A5C5BEZ0_9MICO|nr:hypothetical protein FH969_05810 [Miniimonas arenae]
MRRGTPGGCAVGRLIGGDGGDGADGAGNGTGTAGAASVGLRGGGGRRGHLVSRVGAAEGCSAPRRSGCVLLGHARSRSVAPSAYPS